ncbi:hypothetical protein LCGC14_1431620 [marine sediment metagenome]|uniref:Glycosyltransferase 2-like domain-containing protein n=1 Tax=marine sediment metagenome TaxID=412755 RepID=A0A0F9JNT2_9ZZZZ
MVEDYLTYVCVSTPNLDKLKRHFELIHPYVDGSVIVLGQRDLETENFLNTMSGVTIVHRPWDDSFRAQYQVGLDRISGGWMLWLDDDEVPSQEMLEGLRPIIGQSQGASRFDTVGFRCCDVWDGQVGEPSGYHRELLTAWNPSLRFEVDLHQALLGKMRGVSSDLVYYHHKSTEGSLRGSCRNFFTAGAWADGAESFLYWYGRTGQDPRLNPGGPLTPASEGIEFPLKDGFRIDSWYEMKEILERNHPEVKGFRDLDALIQNGTVCQEFRDWAERHNEHNDKRPHIGEMYGFDKYIKKVLSTIEEC